MDSDAQILWNLERIARRVERKAVSIRTGNYSSDMDEYLDNKARMARPRQDLISIEAVERVLLFLRQLFSQNPSVTWKSDGQGGTDVTSSDLIIESQLAPNDRETDANKPTLLVRPGPTSQGEVVINNLKHWDLLSDTKTYTSLDPGTIQILVHHPVAAVAVELSQYVANALRVHRDDLCHRGFHTIQNIAVGGYDQDNPSYHRRVNQKTHVVIPITFTYFHQSTWRVEHRSNTYEMALGAVVGYAVQESDTEPDPYIDGRADGVLESETVRVLVPLELEE